MQIPAGNFITLLSIFLLSFLPLLSADANNTLTGLPGSCRGLLVKERGRNFEILAPTEIDLSTGGVSALRQSLLIHAPEHLRKIEVFDPSFEFDGEVIMFGKHSNLSAAPAGLWHPFYVLGTQLEKYIQRTLPFGAELHLKFMEFRIRDATPEVSSSDMAPDWHDDDGHVRAILTLQGAGTEFMGDNLRRRENRQINTGEILLFWGRDWALRHRTVPFALAHSMPRDRSQKRMIVIWDFAP